MVLLLFCPETHHFQCRYAKPVPPTPAYEHWSLKAGRRTTTVMFRAMGMRPLRTMRGNALAE
jgi:hypothetical protein